MGDPEFIPVSQVRQTISQGKGPGRDNKVKVGFHGPMFQQLDHGLALDEVTDPTGPDDEYCGFPAQWLSQAR
jgi:hypothetical protein